jgi:hypothetical protein
MRSHRRTLPDTHSAVLTGTQDCAVVSVVHGLEHKVLVTVQLTDAISVVSPHADSAI